MKKENKILMVYCSTKHKNTENLIKSLKDKENITYLDITNELNYDFDKLNEFQIIGFASGIFMSKFHKNIYEFINKIPVQEQKPCFLCFTAGMNNKKFFNKIRHNVEDRGFKIIGEFSCPGFDTFGPLKLIGGINKNRPDNSDKQNFIDFINNLTV